MTRGHRCQPLPRRDASSRLQDRESIMQAEVQLATVCRYVCAFQGKPLSRLPACTCIACLASRLKAGRSGKQGLMSRAAT
jgi:hypothetical protein